MHVTCALLAIIPPWTWSGLGGGRQGALPHIYVVQEAPRARSGVHKKSVESGTLNRRLRDLEDIWDSVGVRAASRGLAHSPVLENTVASSNIEGEPMAAESELTPDSGATEAAESAADIGVAEPSMEVAEPLADLPEAPAEAAIAEGPPALEASSSPVAEVASPRCSTTICSAYLERTTSGLMRVMCIIYSCHQPLRPQVGRHKASVESGSLGRRYRDLQGAWQQLASSIESSEAESPAATPTPAAAAPSRFSERTPATPEPAEEPYAPADVEAAEEQPVASRAEEITPSDHPGPAGQDSKAAEEGLKTAAEQGNTGSAAVLVPALLPVLESSPDAKSEMTELSFSNSPALVKQLSMRVDAADAADDSLAVDQVHSPVRCLTLRVMIPR